MGIIGKFRLATPRQLTVLLEEPEQVGDFLLYGNLEDEDDEVGDDETRLLDIDKAWQGLHFLFTGTAYGGSPPLNFILSGGKELGTRDAGGVGYGPARAFTPAQVQEIAERLKGLTEGELRRRFDPAEMTAQRIYPEIWTYSDEETIGYLLSYYEVLKRFILKGAAEGQALIVYKD